jgi:uncharacterized protein (UPF0332 family)
MASSYGKSRSRNLDFEECLRNRKIILFPRAKKLVPKEMTAAREDLNEARDRLVHGKFKYATINSYYAIFHAARALLYSRGYRERSHSCLAVALEALFVEQGLLEIRFVRIFRESMALRENADYTGSFSREAAEQTLANGEAFMGVARHLLRLAG